MKIIIHGGFIGESSLDEPTKQAKKQALQDIVTKSYEFLKTHNAEDTVVFAVSLLEDEPLFNAGIGSRIQSDGVIRMSASLMNGATLKFSGVINIEEVKNPIQVAQSLMKVDDRVLGGPCAVDYARSHGFEKFSTEIPERREEYNKHCQESNRLGTVGCVVLDAYGNIAAGTSTGGKGFEIPGRISDSATTAGNYANQNCGISCTGVGEDIVSLSISSKIATRVDDGMSIGDAFEKTFLELKKIDGFAGAIGIDKGGSIYYLDSFPKMVFAHYDGETLGIFD